jgi:hypothetical protein
LWKKPFQAAKRLREQHIKDLDNFFKAQLDKYYQHPQLTTYVVFVDSNEAWTIYKEEGEKYPACEDEFLHPTLAQLDNTLGRLDERALSLHMVVDSHNIVPKAVDIRFLDENKRICNEYRELLLEFLKNPARAGQHVLNGARFATAAFYCLQHVSVGRTTRYIMFSVLQLICPNSFMLACRVALRQSLQLALIYIRLLLPRSSKSEELMNLAKNYTFVRHCTENFPYDTRLAQEAITTYLAKHRVTWSQNLRITVARTQEGIRRPNQPESTEAGNDIQPLSAQHRDPPVTNYHRNLRRPKKLNVRFNST